MSDAVEEIVETGEVESAPFAETLAIRELLERLPTADRALLELRYVEDLTQPEVARLLKVPEGTVKVRLHRLRARLRGELTLMED